MQYHEFIWSTLDSYLQLRVISLAFFVLFSIHRWARRNWFAKNVWNFLSPEQRCLEIVTCDLNKQSIIRYCTETSIELYLSHIMRKPVLYHMSPVKRICVFEHSVMTNFNCACPAIQRGQGSGFLSEGSSWLNACMSEQRRLWRDCADAQARLNLRCSHRRLVPNSLDAVHMRTTKTQSAQSDQCLFCSLPR